MKISVTDKHGSGIILEFARAIGANIQGRFFHIPESKGGGYITGFSWENGLRMMMRNYYLHEEILLERTNELAEGQDDIIFLLSGIFPYSVQQEKQLMPEQASVFICAHAVSSVLTMPSNTFFRSVTIAVPRRYLLQFFGSIQHPVVISILEAKDNFAYETSISPEMIRTASEILHPTVPESLESHYCKLKCEELLCYIFALLMQREAVPTSSMHINDIKAIYAIKFRLQSLLDKPPHIASLAREAGMSEPKMRKLFKQTFGKGVFEYYQSMRMQEAARLLKEKRLTVSEVGYQLGFTNLSHFSRVFEQHTGMKPKKYSVT
ncbi:helix-turn-helix domain-containing protein [Chitinophaga oryziterrae]|uniref:Helix-turn-helix domain-containing protein n=1 Tax=Chitinophaga oryziterrae TaxID=1031224 RepID=A0A6N8JC98_9BACT|nr:helix-turn-helix transcriptional regulator [Chitinophaga oryziterrae]MVT42877.1 helix-turn-helix domain-containing protein [Chitinophaga oryziterrae]